MMTEAMVKELQEKIGQYDIEKSRIMEKYHKATFEQQELVTQLNQAALDAYKVQTAKTNNGLIIPNGGNVKMGPNAN